MEQLTTRKLLEGVGLIAQPDYYLAFREHDLNEHMLMSIYNSIYRKIGKEEAQNYVTVVRTLRNFSTYNFITALNKLEENSWQLSGNILEGQRDLPECMSREKYKDMFLLSLEKMSEGKRTINHALHLLTQKFEESGYSEEEVKKLIKICKKNIELQMQNDSAKKVAILWTIDQDTVSKKTSLLYMFKKANTINKLGHYEIIINASSGVISVSEHKGVPPKVVVE